MPAHTEIRNNKSIASAVHWIWARSRRTLSRLFGWNAPGHRFTSAPNRDRVGGVSWAEVTEAGLGGLARRYVLDPYARRRKRRLAIAHLAALDDRLLADIGLLRSEIERAVDGKLERKTDRRDRHGKQPVSPLEVRRELPLAA